MDVAYAAGDVGAAEAVGLHGKAVRCIVAGDKEPNGTEGGAERQHAVGPDGAARIRAGDVQHVAGAETGNRAGERTYVVEHGPRIPTESQRLTRADGRLQGDRRPRGGRE